MTDHLQTKPLIDDGNALFKPLSAEDRARAILGSGDVCGSYAPDERHPPKAYRSVEEIRREREEYRREAHERYGVGHLYRPLGTPEEAVEAMEMGVNPKDLIGATKTPLGLLPWTGLVQVARVMALGAKKYGPHNWRTKGKAVQHMTYCEAALRHLAAYIDGQTLDPESGENHLAHVAACMMIVLDASAIGNSVDNRPTPGVAAELMALK